MSIASSRKMLVKRKSTSSLLIKNSESCSKVSLAKVNESFTFAEEIVEQRKSLKE